MLQTKVCSDQTSVSKYHKLSLVAARVVIRDEKDVVYETAGDYNYGAEMQQKKAYMIN